MAIQTKIRTPDGKDGVGYIIGGQTYKDAAGNERVDAGTTVQTNGGEYTYQGNGVSTPYYKSTYHDANGNQNDAFIRNGVAYSDDKLTKPVNYGSVVKTQGGDFYKDPQTGRGVRVTKVGGDQDSFKYGGNFYKIYRDNKGVLYVDESCTVRVPDGATVTIGGRSYINSHSSGLVPSHNSVAQGYGDKMSGVEANIRSSADEQRAAANARKNQRINALNAQRSAIEAEYERNNRASYNAYLNAINPYGVNAEKMAQLGLSDSGYAETTMAKIANAYQTAIAGNAEDRANSLLELELAIDDAIADGNEAEANIGMQMYTNIANMQAERAKTQSDYEMYAADKYNSDYWSEKKFNEGVRQADAENNLKRELFETENARETAAAIMGYLSAGYSYEELSKLLGIPVNTLKVAVSQYYQ